jgi:ribonuclease P protein component
MRFTFHKHERLRTARDFARVKQDGRSWYSPALTVRISSSGQEHPARLGLVVSKKVGIAVKRNRIKRVIREVFRLNKHRIKSGNDIVAIPRQAAISWAYGDCETVFMSLIAKAGILHT